MRKTLLCIGIKICPELNLLRLFGDGFQNESMSSGSGAFRSGSHSGLQVFGETSGGGAVRLRYGCARFVITRPELTPLVTEMRGWIR